MSLIKSVKGIEDQTKLYIIYKETQTHSTVSATLLVLSGMLSVLLCSTEVASTVGALEVEVSLWEEWRLVFLGLVMGEDLTLQRSTCEWISERLTDWVEKMLSARAVLELLTEPEGLLEAVVATEETAGGTELLLVRRPRPTMMSPEEWGHQYTLNMKLHHEQNSV